MTTKTITLRTEDWNSIINALDDYPVRKVRKSEQLRRAEDSLVFAFDACDMQHHVGAVNDLKSCVAPLVAELLKLGLGYKCEELLKQYPELKPQ